MAKSKQAVDNRQDPNNLKQGYVREKDLQPEADGGVMTTDEENSYTRKAESNIKPNGDQLQGEGDYEAAESYDQAATDFAQSRKGK